MRVNEPSNAFTNTSQKLEVDKKKLQMHKPSFFQVMFYICWYHRTHRNVVNHFEIEHDLMMPWGELCVCVCLLMCVFGTVWDQSSQWCICDGTFLPINYSVANSLNSFFFAKSGLYFVCFIFEWLYLRFGCFINLLHSVNGICTLRAFLCI